MQIALEGKLRLDRAPETVEEVATLRQLKTALNRLGYYMPDPKTGITHDIDANLTDALYAYQRKSTIMPDDMDIAPNSTTERMLNQDLASLDESALYVWRTVGDEKVRGSHAKRNGQRFSWATPPDGGHTGEDYNCRCWTEPLVAPYHPWIEWVEDRRELREKLTPFLGVKDKIADLKTSVPLDAINPAISPLDFIGIVSPVTRALVGGGASLMRSKIVSKEHPASTRINSYDQALSGGKHTGFLKKYKNVSNEELIKGIKSFDKQINRHLEKIKNPEKEYPNFKSLDQRQQKSLLEKKWPSDIKRLEEEREILRRILDERK